MNEHTSEYKAPGFSIVQGCLWAGSYTCLQGCQVLLPHGLLSWPEAQCCLGKAQRWDGLGPQRVPQGVCLRETDGRGR